MLVLAMEQRASANERIKAVKPSTKPLELPKTVIQRP
jgi:hypothetical protein